MNNLQLNISGRGGQVNDTSATKHPLNNRGVSAATHPSFGHCLEFDGSAHLQTPNLNIDYSEGFSVSAWVWYEEFNNWSRIMDFGQAKSNGIGSANENIVLANIGTENGLRFVTFNGSNATRIDIPNILETRQWIHIAATISPTGEGKVYKNGVLIEENSAMHLPNSIERDLSYIGKSNWPGNALFKGKIAEVKVYNKALSLAEINRDIVSYGAIAPQALNFNGTDTSVEIPLTIPKQDITHEFWFKTDQPNGGMFMGRNDNGNRHDRHLWLSGGNVHSRVWNNEILNSSGLQLNDGQWHHVAHTLGSAGQILYIDGAKVASGTKTKSDVSEQTFIIIGKSQNGRPKNFNGQIREVRLWTIERSQSEIQEGMYQNYLAPQEGLLCSLPLNEVSGREVNDYSGNGHNGQIVGVVDRQHLNYNMKFINRSQFLITAYTISGNTLTRAFELAAGLYYEENNVASDYVFKTVINGVEHTVDKYFASAFDKEFVIQNTLAAFVNKTEIPLDIYERVNGQDTFKNTLAIEEEVLLENINDASWVFKVKELSKDGSLIGASAREEGFDQGFPVYEIGKEVNERTIEVRTSDIETYLKGRTDNWWREPREIRVKNTSNIKVEVIEGNDISTSTTTTTPIVIQPNEEKTFYTAVGGYYRVQEYDSKNLIGFLVITYANRDYAITDTAKGTEPTKVEFVNETFLELEVYAAGNNNPITPTLGHNQSIIRTCQTGQLFYIKDKNSGIIVKAIRAILQAKIYRIQVKDLKSNESDISVQAAFTNNFGFPIDMYFIDNEGKQNFLLPLEDKEAIPFPRFFNQTFLFQKQDTQEAVGTVILSQEAYQSYDLKLKSPTLHTIDTNGLRSISGNNKSAVFSFFNKTGFNLDIYWINYNGERQQLYSANNNQQINIATYVTHPWVSCKQGTDEVMGYYIANNKPNQSYTAGTPLKLVNPTDSSLIVEQVGTDGSWVSKGTINAYSELELFGELDLSYFIIRSNSTPTYVIDMFQVRKKKGLLDKDGVFVHKIRTAHLRSIDNGSVLTRVDFKNDAGQDAKLYRIDQNGNWDFRQHLPQGSTTRIENRAWSQLRFNGINTYVSIPLDEREEEISNTCWFKTYSANGGLFSALDAAGNLNGVFDRGVYLKDGGIYARLYQEETIGNSNMNLVDNQWHHLAHTIGAGEQKLYVDGKLVAEGNLGYSDLKEQGSLALGFSNVASSNFFNGHIYRFRAWRKALTPYEINTLIYEGALGSQYYIPKHIPAFNLPEFRGADIGLIGEWYLDDAEGNHAWDFVDSTHKHHGTIYNGNWEQLSGFVDLEPIRSNYRYVAVSKPTISAPRFNGSNTIIQLEDQVPDSNITHELWFKTDQGNGGLFMCIDSNNNNNDKHLYLNGGNIYARIWDGTNSQRIYTIGLSLNDSNWHHLAYTLNESGQALYIDGVKVVQGNQSSSSSFANNKIVIGKSYEASSEVFKGNIAHVRLWKRALSQKEIQQQMYLRIPGHTTDLQHYWPMDDEQREVKDLTGRADLTLPSSFSAWTFSDHFPLTKRFEVLKEWTPMKASDNYATLSIDNESGATKGNAHEPQNGQVVVYTGTNYTGTATLLTTNVSDASFLSACRSMKLGPETEVNLFDRKHFNGSERSYHFDQANVTGSVQSIHIEHVVNEKVVGISSKCSLTEEYLYFDGDGEVCSPEKPGAHMAKCHAYQTILTVPPTARKVEVSTLTSGDEVTLIVDHKTHSVDFNKAAYFKPNALSKVVITEVLLDKDGKYSRTENHGELTTPGLRIRTNEMPDNEYIHVFPDSNMYKTVTNLKDGHLYESAQAGKLGDSAKTLNKENCDHIQKAIQNLGKTAHHIYERTQHGLKVNRSVKPHSMEHPHWELSFDDTQGRHQYRALSKTESETVQADAGTEIVLDNTSLNFLSTLGGWLEDGGKGLGDIVKIGFHTIVEAGEDTIDTTAKVGRVFINTGQNVVDDIAQGNINGAMMDFGHGSLSFFNEAKDGFGKVLNDLIDGGEQITNIIEKEVEEIIKMTIHFADEAFHIIVRDLKIIGEAIGHILRKIGATIEEFVKFLAFLFDWEDILHTQDILNQAFDTTMDNFADGTNSILNDIKSHVDDMFNTVRTDVDKTIEDAKKKYGVDDSVLNSSHQDQHHEGALQKLEWLLSRLFEGDHSNSTAPSTNHPPDPVHTDFMTEVMEDVDNQLFSTIERASGQAEDLLLEAIHQPNKLPQILVTLGLDIVEDIFDPAINILQSVVDHTFEHAGTSATIFKGMVQEEINLPFIKDLFELIDGGNRFSVQNLTTLFLAVPSTILLKVIEGEAPFKDVDNVTLAAAQEKRSWAGVYGMCQFLDGVLSAVLDVILKPNEGLTVNSNGGGRVALLDGNNVVFYEDDTPTSLMILLNVVSTLNNILKQFSGLPGGYFGDAFPTTRNFNRLAIGIWGYQWLANGLDIISILVDVTHYRFKYNSFGKMSLGLTIGYEVIHLILFAIYDGMQNEQASESEVKTTTNLIMGQLKASPIENEATQQAISDILDTLSGDLPGSIRNKVNNTIYKQYYEGKKTEEEIMKLIIAALTPGIEPAVKQVANIIDPLKGIVSSILMILKSEEVTTKTVNIPLPEKLGGAKEVLVLDVGIVASDLSFQFLYAGLQWGFTATIK